MGQDLNPYAGKFLTVLMNGLTDRNAAVRKHYANAIGHVVRTAKDSSVEKLFNKLQNMYFKIEDESMRSVIAHTIQSIGVQNQEILKSYSNIVLPLVFFAMHAEKTPDTKTTIELWSEIWSENSPGTETGIRQNMDEIFQILQTALESPNWTIKSQAASSISTVATKLGATMETKYRNATIKMLLSGLSGRTWNGKEKLLNALASICKSCKEVVKNDPEIDVNLLIDTVLKECRKDEIIYKKHALEALGDILCALEMDKFEDIYNIAQIALAKNDGTANKDEDLSVEETSKKRENTIRLKETIYETIGKSWPANVETQEKYRELFVEHCSATIPNSVRSVQVCIIVALIQYVDKLSLLNKKEMEMSSVEKDSLIKILENISKVLNYTLDVSKHMKLRKESLNVLLTSTKKLKDAENATGLKKINEIFEHALPELDKDVQPEIKTRSLEMKELLKDKLTREN